MWGCYADLRLPTLAIVFQSPVHSSVPARSVRVDVIQLSILKLPQTYTGLNEHTYILSVCFIQMYIDNLDGLVAKKVADSS